MPDPRSDDSVERGPGSSQGLDRHYRRHQRANLIALLVLLKTVSSVGALAMMYLVLFGNALDVGQTYRIVARVVGIPAVVVAAYLTIRGLLRRKGLSLVGAFGLDLAVIWAIFLTAPI